MTSASDELLPVEQVALLPCPFCGNPRPEAVGSPDGDYVECGSCLAMMQPHDPEVPNEIVRWNTRLTAASAVVAEQVERDHNGGYTLAEERGSSASPASVRELREALEAKATWFRFNSATGEYQNEYCSVKPNDAHGFVPMVSIDAALALTESATSAGEAR